MPRKAAAKPAEGEVIEGEVRDVTPPDDQTGGAPERAVVVAPTTSVQAHLAVGVGALASMSDVAFEHNLEMLAKGVERSRRVKEAIMVEDEDYGLIPGTKSPTLLKPGAEKLALVYGLVGRFVHTTTYGDGVRAPQITVTVDTFIHLGDHDGPVVAQGMGTANSWEKRYRYRGSKGRTCPTCGEDTVIVSPRDRDLPPERQSWWCGPRDGGCGANYPAGTAEIVDQPNPGKAENLDPHELANTLLKMAEKRSFVDGVMRATASSGLFTQDMEENEEGSGYGGSGTGGAPSGSRQPARNAPQSRSAPQGGGQGQSARSEAPAAFDGDRKDVVTVVIAEQPDSGVRMVKDSHKELRWEGVRPKLEVIGKVANRKHTAIVLGPLAEAAVLAEIKIGEAVMFVGVTVEEITWAEDKPTKKEVWGNPPTYLMEDVLVGRNEQWVSVKTFAPTLPLEPSSSEQPAPTAGSGSQPSADASSSASQPTSSPAATTLAAPSSDSPSTPAATSTAPTTEPPKRRTGTPGDYELIIGELTDDVQRVVRGQTPVAVLRVADKATGELVMIGLSSDIDEQIGPFEDPWLKAGDEVNVFGRWAPNKEWMIADTVGKPTK